MRHGSMGVIGTEMFQTHSLRMKILSRFYGIFVYCNKII